MKNIKSFIINSSIVAAVVMTPFAAFAKGNDIDSHAVAAFGSGDAHASLSAQANFAPAFAPAKNDAPTGLIGDIHGLGNAFGHLIAPGWLAKNANASSNANTNINIGPGIKTGDGDHDGDADDNPGRTSTTTPGTGTTTAQAVDPVITGITAPTVLTVGQDGTWTVNAYDPQNGSLSYSVNWGDRGITPLALTANQTVFVQSATFSHAYANAGTYTVTFIVQNSAGLTNTSSVTVHIVSSATTTPVTISNVSATSTRQRGATIHWTTSQPATSVVWFATTSPIDTSASTTVPQIVRNNRVINHTISLTGLQPGTTYYVVVGSVGASRVMATSSETSFTTPLPPNSQAPVITSVQGSSTLDVNQTGTWTVNASDPRNSSLSYSVDWGDSPSVGLLALFKRAPVFVQTATFTHSYVNPGTYTITFKVENSAGLMTSATTSVAVTATTTTVAPPVISNVAASSTALGQETLSWTTDQAANSKVWFSASSSVDTSATSTIDDSSFVTVHSETLSGLATSTTYYAVVGSTNESGVMSTSSPVSFTTTASTTSGM